MMREKEEKEHFKVGVHILRPKSISPMSQAEKWAESASRSGPKENFGSHMSGATGVRFGIESGF